MNEPSSTQTSLINNLDLHFLLLTPRRFPSLANEARRVKEVPFRGFKNVKIFAKIVRLQLLEFGLTKWLAEKFDFLPS